VRTLSAQGQLPSHHGHLPTLPALLFSCLWNPPIPRRPFAPWRLERGWRRGRSTFDAIEPLCRLRDLTCSNGAAAAWSRFARQVSHGSGIYRHRLWPALGVAGWGAQLRFRRLGDRWPLLSPGKACAAALPLQQKGSLRCPRSQTRVAEPVLPPSEKPAPISLALPPEKISIRQGSAPACAGLGTNWKSARKQPARRPLRGSLQPCGMAPSDAATISLIRLR